ncbi:hypothetical protein D068_cds41010 [Bacillus atrophaeus UCMB-5137]|nr:hypothetical protein D068_cds41010 [Bacillus atrophaeus UCMB-5137]
MDDMRKQRLPRFDKKAENVIGKLFTSTFAVKGAFYSRDFLS